MKARQLARPFGAFAVSLAVTGALVGVPVARAAVATVTVTATILRNLSVRTQAQMAFGDLDTSDSAGTIILGQDGTRVATGGAQLESDSVASPAALEIRGAPNASFSISIPASARIADAAGEYMVVDQFRQSTGTVASLDSTGRRVVRFGATLHINPNQPLGTYAGTMEVEVNYN